MLRRWRALADGYDPERLLLGETWVLDLDELATFYGDSDELQLGIQLSVHVRRAGRCGDSRTW